MQRTALIAGFGVLLMAQAQPQGQPQAQPRAQAPRPAPGAPAPAAAQIPTRASAQTLTALCGQDRSACLGYVLGAADAYAAALVAAGRPQTFCVPKGTTNEQIAQSAVRYLRAHPEESGSNAALVVLVGLKAAYPCGY